MLSDFGEEDSFERLSRCLGGIREAEEWEGQGYSLCGASLKFDVMGMLTGYFGQTLNT